MDAYTQSSQKHFALSGIIKLVYRLHPTEAECLCEYVAMPMVLVFTVPLWRVNMSLYVSKLWKIFRLLL